MCIAARGMSAETKGSTEPQTAKTGLKFRGLMFLVGRVRLEWGCVPSKSDHLASAIQTIFKSYNLTKEELHIQQSQSVVSARSAKSISSCRLAELWHHIFVSDKQPVNGTCCRERQTPRQLVLDQPLCLPPDVREDKHQPPMTLKGISGLENGMRVGWMETHRFPPP